MTGDPTPYTKKDEAALAQWIKAAEAGDGTSLEDGTGFTVRADVEWAGEKNARAHRNLKVDRADLGAIAKAARGLPDAANPRLSTYTAKGWQSQYNALQRTKAGREALAGELHVSGRTQARWGAGKQAPSRANQEAIRAAYEARATDPGAVGRAAARAEHRVAEAVSKTLEDRFGWPIRLTNISEFKITD